MHPLPNRGALRQPLHPGGTAPAAERQGPERRLLQGRRLKASDGSTVTLADTPKNQQKYPQQKGQKRGCGFPILRLSVVFSLPSSAVLQVAQGNYYQHELRLFHTLQDQFQAGDVVIYDRAAGNFVVAALLRHWRLELCRDDLKTTLGRETLRCLSPALVEKELLAFLIAHHLTRWVMAQAAREHAVDLYRISFTGTLDAFRHFATAMAQAKSAKKRRQIWDELLRTLADDLVPERPGRIEPRAVKRRPKPYPLLNKPRHQFREIRHRSRYKRITCN